MLTLDAALHIPPHVSFSVVGQDAFLLNTRTNKYYGLQEVGVRLWQLLNEGKSLRIAHQLILQEYEVETTELEKDLLELVTHLQENGLVEFIEA